MPQQAFKLTLFGMLLFAGLVFAKPTTSQLSSQLNECQKIEENLARLNCYDQLASTTATPKPSEDATNAAVKSVEKPQQNAISSPESAFGIEQKLIAEQAPEQLKAKVVKVVKNPYGQLKFTLDNGQVWKQSSSHRLRLKVDETIIINRGIMGAFRLQKENSNRNFDVKRVK